MAQLKALGGLKLEPVPFSQPKPLLLLAYLALEGAQQRRHLAELFWQEGNRMKSLSMTLTRLRQGAEGVVAADEKRAWTTSKSDAGELLEALDKSQWRRAYELYSGAFLEGVVLEDWGSELEEWVYTTREYLAERVQHALLSLAEEAAQAQDFQAAADLAERAYKLPGVSGSEVSVLKRLYTLLSAGQNLHAPEVRKELESYHLKLSLSTEAARALFQPLAAVPHNLVPRTTSFIGRERELADLALLLEKPECRLLSIIGPGGVGKTRLAFQTAENHLRRGSYPEGVYWVMLETLSQSRLLASHLAAALGLPNKDDPQQLIDAIADKRMLLALDNFEHLAEAAPLLEELLGSCPNLKLLVTSRERLYLGSEHLFPLGGLQVPETAASYQEARAFGAVRLFAERARQLRPDLELEAELPHILDLCRRLEGLPLGLELASGWVRLMSCADIAAELESNLDFLTSTLRNTPKRHRSLRAVFEASWRLLTPKEQEVLCKLAVFRGGFRREAASEVAGATLPILASLMDKSLLRVAPNGRYDQHPLIHQLAREKLEEEELERLQMEHAGYYLRFVRAQEEAVQQGRQKDALRIFHEEWDNCRVVPEHLLKHADTDGLLHWVELVDSYYDVRGAYGEALEFLTRAEELLGSSHPEALGRVLLEKGWCLVWLGSYEAARQAVREGLLLIPKAEERWRARGLNTLGIIACNIGQYEEARALWRNALKLAETTRFTIYEAHIAGNLGIAETELGNPAEAEPYHLLSLELYQRLGVINGYARELMNLAFTYFHMGRLGEARTLIVQGLEIARDIDYKLHLPYGLTTLGTIEHATGDYPSSRKAHAEALELSRTTGDRFIEAEALVGLAVAACALKQYPEALERGAEALILAQAIGSQSKWLQALLARAELFLSLAKAEEAARLLAVVLQHPVAAYYERTRAQALIGELAGRLSPFQLEAAKTFARSASLEDILNTALPTSLTRQRAKPRPDPHDPSRIRT